MPKKAVVVGLLCSLFLCLVSCCDEEQESTTQKELLIYCGATMPGPIREIADRFEKQQDCIVKMIIGGSGTLYRSIEVNNSGDLYLPGSESYIQKAQADGWVTETQVVGYNRAALFVAKGNPLGIPAQLDSLLNMDYRTVLGAPDSGSIGRETKRILSKAGIYEQAIDHALFLTSDSKGLRQAIVDGTADLTLNWYATAFWAEGGDQMDVLRLDESIAPSHPLVMGVLKCSTNSELARKFIHLAQSPSGHESFQQHGFGE